MCGLTLCARVYLSLLCSCVFSLVFAIAGQLLVSLPVYFLAPFTLFVSLIASSLYVVAFRDTFGGWTWPLLALNAWWLITTPYWSIIHFLTFPFIFTASLGLQLALFTAASVAVLLYPALPSEAQRYYSSLLEQRQQRTLPQPTPDHPQSSHKQSHVSPPQEGGERSRCDEKRSTTTPERRRLRRSEERSR